MNPWDRRQGESTPAYAAFVTYRDMGPERALRAVARKLGKSGSLITRWSTQHSWVFRVDQFDAEMRRVAEGELRRQIGEDASRNATLFRGGQAAVSKALTKLLAALDSEDFKVSYSSVMASLEMMLRLQEITEGAARERFEHGRIGPPSSSAREELIRRIEALGARMQEEEAAS